MCTSFRLTATNGDVVVGRTMEFAADLGWRLMVVGRGSAFTGTGPAGPGHRWEAAHGFVGISALGRPSATDGVNEAGLSASLLYLPGETRYQAHEDVDPGCLVSADEVVSLVLATAATVDEAVAAVESVVVWNRVEEILGDILPVHLVLHDRRGAAAVVEWVGGSRQVHDNPVGVCTNSPTFDWHLTNLRNYVNLRPTNVMPVTLDGETFASTGQGSGLLGLPGDWTPPSRFVRAAALAAATFPPADGTEGLGAALHVVNAFDIPRGLVRDPAGTDYTQWVTVSDLAGGAYAVRTYDDPTPRQVRLRDLTLAGGGVRTSPLPSAVGIPDLVV